MASTNPYSIAGTSPGSADFGYKVNLGRGAVGGKKGSGNKLSGSVPLVTPNLTSPASGKTGSTGGKSGSKGKEQATAKKNTDEAGKAAGKDKKQASRYSTGEDRGSTRLPESYREHFDLGHSEGRPGGQAAEATSQNVSTYAIPNPSGPSEAADLASTTTRDDCPYKAHT